MSVIIKTTFTVTVLHEAHSDADRTFVDSLNLEQVAEFISTGEGIGEVSNTVIQEIARDEVRGELLKLGNDGEFFDLSAAADEPGGMGSPPPASETLEPGDIPHLTAAGYTVKKVPTGWIFNDPDGNDYDLTPFSMQTTAWLAAKRDERTRPA